MTASVEVAAYLAKGVTVAVLIPVLSTVLYYLGYWAQVTEPIWSRYSPRIGTFMHCPACSGTWFAGALGVAAWLAGLPFLIFPPLHSTLAAFNQPGLRWVTPLLAALWGTFWVPKLAVRYLADLSAIPEEPNNDTEQEVDHSAQEQP